ncbi:hypothetical protein E2562_010438 [Oryza meyeriana var. granulata]|uniref:Uncharacterized protein n=1 Tax=Oryza meyeriana var. granulata TaxID=110450 RepID=A0A6G1F6L7_9ORYZ|nr:hypothetical protein E2562_010438 [Oryza meyeriana var. granulata]
MDPPGKKSAAAAVTVGAQPVAPSPGKGTTLLDVYEVEWITRELERLLVRESGCGGGGRAGDGHHRRKGMKVAGSYRKPATDRKGGFLTELLGRHDFSICSDTAAAAAAVVSGRALRGRGSFREVEKV